MKIKMLETDICAYFSVFNKNLSNKVGQNIHSTKSIKVLSQKI